MAAVVPGAAKLTVTSSGTMLPPTPRDAKGKGWKALSSTVRDTNRLLRVTAVMQRQDYGRTQKKFGTALAPTANSTRWDVQEAYRSMFATRLAPQNEHKGVAGQETGVKDDPFMTPEFEEVLMKEWQKRHSHFSSKVKSRFISVDDKQQAQKEREVMWEKLRRKFRMLR